MNDRVLLEQAKAAAHCARSMSRMAVQYAREGDPLMAFEKRREARWWLNCARQYVDLIEYDPMADGRFAAAVAMLRDEPAEDAA